MAAGVVAALIVPPPDLLITGDGRHVALNRADGPPLMLRERSGDFTRSLMAESAGFDGETGWIEDSDGARCSTDACRFDVVKDDRTWSVLAFRSSYLPSWQDTVAACAASDIVVAERRLPRGCVPKWLKLDGPALRTTGGLAILLGNSPRIRTVADRVAQHPWRE